MVLTIALTIALNPQAQKSSLVLKFRCLFTNIASIILDFRFGLPSSSSVLMILLINYVVRLINRVIRGCLSEANWA